MVHQSPEPEDRFPVSMGELSTPERMLKMPTSEVGAEDGGNDPFGKRSTRGLAGWAQWPLKTAFFISRPSLHMMF